MSQIYFFIFLCLFPSFAFSSGLSASEIDRFSSSTEWLALLHYNKKGNGWLSDVQTGDYFLSRNGRKDPKAELLATLEAFQSPDKLVGPSKQPALCAFQGRKHLLVQKFNIEFPKVKCELWDRFYEQFKDAKTLSVVFSTAYPNNPGSMFGHLFMKVGFEKESDFFDIGVNYAALVLEDDNGLVFAYKGILGGYLGKWSIQPYYEKLNEYVKSESRDVWEYELSLTPTQVDYFVKILWEIETTSTNQYYFFDDNCAYRIVRIIEAIRPEWTVSNHTIYAIPGEIVKNLFNEESIVRKIKVKPSLKRKVMAQYQSMTEEEKLKSKRLVQLVSDETSLEVSSANAKILSFANLYFENLRQRKKGKLTQKENKRWNEIQKALSQSSEKVMLATPQKVTTQPELGHNSYAVRAQLVNNLKLNRSYLHLDLQSAYHDLKNIDLAYSPFSQLIFPSIQFRADDKKIYFDKLTFVDIISLTPYTWIDPQVSWQARVFAKSYSFYDESIQNILVGRVGAGLSIEPLNQKLLFFQVGAQNESARLDESYQSLFLTTGILANFSEKIKTGLIATRFFKGRDQTVQYHTESEVEQFVTYSWRRNLEIRQSLAWSKFQTEADLAKKSENLEILFGPSFYF